MRVSLGRLIVIVVFALAIIVLYSSNKVSFAGGDKGTSWASGDDGKSDDDSGGGKKKKPKKDWKTSGNENIDPDNYFLGTTDAADLVIKTDNVEKMRVTTDGDVGIGTASPTGTLHVEGGSADGSTNGKDITLNAQDGGPAGGAGGNIFLIPGASGDGFAPDGKVIVGTDLNKLVLDVNGRVTIRGGAPWSGWVLTAIDSTGAAIWQEVDVNDADSDPTNELQDLTGASLADTTLQIDIEDGDSASVDLSSLQDGIGTDDQTLSLLGTALSIEDGNTVDLSGIGGGDNLGDHTATQNLSLMGFWLSGDGGNEGISVDNAGNVGIGTISPGEKLSVNGIIESTTGGFKFPDGSIQTEAGGASSSLNTPDASQTDVLVVDTSGKIGIGTAIPTEKLEVVGNIKSSGNVHASGVIKSGNSLIIDGTALPGAPNQITSTSGELAIGGADGFSFPDIKVGIGTTSPSAELEVNGTVAAGTFSSTSPFIIEAPLGTERMRIDDTTGNVGIGDITPEFKLSLDNDGGIIAKGTLNSGATLTTSGAGTRMMWYPRKAAFRVGRVSGTQWNVDKVGQNSTAVGSDTTASGTYSTAMGWSTTASGTSSTAMGSDTTASGHSSTAMGLRTTASGNYSTAMGREIEAQGDYSVAIALNDQNGNVVSQDNTMAIMGGNVGIGTKSPIAKLHVKALSSVTGISASSGGGNGVGGSSISATGVWGSSISGIGVRASSLSSFGVVSGSKNGTGILAQSETGDLIQGRLGGPGGSIGSIIRFRVTNGGDVEVAGQIKITGGTPGLNRVLTSDASGLASWEAASTGPWTQSGSDIYYDTGNVGIGTTGPGSRLEIKGSGSTSGTAGLNVTNSAGTSGLYVRDDGNVGIGETNPSARLDVVGDTELNGNVDINSDLDVDAGTLHVDGANDRVGIGDTAPDGKLEVNPDGIEDNGDEFVVDSSGNVGIGTTGPGSRLEIKGSGSTYATAGLNVTNSAGTSGLYVRDDGNVGIGTTNPRVELQIGDPLTTGGANPVISIQGSGTLNPFIDIGEDSSNKGSIFWSNNNDFLEIRTTVAGTQHLGTLVLDNGDVGIGDSTPDGKLEVRQTGTDDILNLYDSTTNVFTVQDGGDVGIGDITPVGKLEVRQNGTDDIFNLWDGARNVFHVQDGGNVGIGKTFTAYKLDVSGTDQTTARFNRSGTDGSLIDFHKDDVWVGGISFSGGTLSYYPFTGSHYGWTSEVIERGMLVSLTGINRNLHDNPDAEIIYGVVKSTTANDPKILGSYLSLQEPGNPTSHQNPHLITAVGNGDMWVADTGENIEIGDYLISSHVPGHAMKDQGDYDISYIVARAAEPVDWANGSETTYGTKHKKISVLFESLVRTHASDKAIAELKTENEQLREKLTALVDRQEALEDMLLAISTTLPKEKLVNFAQVTSVEAQKSVQ